MKAAVKRVCPPAEELGAPILTNLPCLDPHCSMTFKQSAARRLHMEKKHHVIQATASQNEEGETIQYHCPENSCVFGVTRERFFVSQKNLRQHYMKHHMEKKFSCLECNKTFSLERDMRRHHKVCKTTYTCPTCNNTFNLWTTYLNHCSRNGHNVDRSQNVDLPLKDLPSTAKEKRTRTKSSQDNIPEKNKVVEKQPRSQPQPILPTPQLTIMNINMVLPPNDKNVNQPSTCTTPACTLLLMTSSFPTVKPKPMVIQAMPVSSQESQQSSYLKTSDDKNSEIVHSADTVAGHVDSINARPHKSKAPLFSAATQTSVYKRKRTVAQTQTTGDFILRRAMLSADIPIQKQSRASQVSPRAKLKQDYMTEVQTQTVGGPKPYRKRRRRKPPLETVTVEQQTRFSSLVDDLGPTLYIPDWPSTATQTQTMALLEELQLAESISTQTLESYLASGQVVDSTQVSGSYTGGLTELSLGGTTADLGVMTDLCGISPITRATQSESSSGTELGWKLPVNSGGVSCTTTTTAHLQDACCSTVDTSDLFGAQSSFMLPEANSIQTSNQDLLELPLCDTDTQTLDLDLPQLLTSEAQTSDFDPSYMNIETQTGEDDGDNVFDQLLSNNQTQTTDDFLVDLCFSDIETQTPLTMSASAMGPMQTTQTQTSLQAATYPQGPTHSSDMQTQTLFANLEFLPNLADSYTQTGFQELENFVQNLD